MKDYFDTSFLDTVRDAVNGLVDRMANKLYNAGKIKSKYFAKQYMYLWLIFNENAIHSLCCFETVYTV